MRFLSELWAHRRDLGGLWWRGIAAVGMPKQRFHSLPGWQQRAGKVALGGVIAFLLSVFVNVLEHAFGSGSTGAIVRFDTSAYLAFAILAALLIPEWKALPSLPLRLVLPGAVVVAGIGGVVAALATHDTKNGVIVSLG